MTELLNATDEASALDWLHDNGCTDGLPVVIPTPARVERFVLATGLDADLTLGAIGPGNGAATIEGIATNAVMAGCLPDYMPIVVAAIQAMLKPEFDLAEMQSTTHNTAPLVVVNGPMADYCSVASGFGALGPGFRANATIGRAIRLCLMNIGMARPGQSDMALLGHPGKFSYCLAEDEASSPWAPLHTQWGFTPEQSAVTVIGAEAPHSVIFVNDADDPASPERLLATLGAVLANVGSNNAHFGVGAQTIILNPEHAAVLAEAGMSRDDVAHQLAQRAVTPHDLLTTLNPAFARGKSDPTPAVRRPSDLIILVAGGPGLYSTVMPSWGAGAHSNPAVFAEVPTDEACEIPLSPAPATHQS